MNHIKKIIQSVLIYIVLGFTVIISIFPIIWVVFSSFKTNAQILSSPFSLPTSLGFGAYQAVFKQTDFLMYTLNSLLIAAISTAISLVIYAMAAYVIARYDFKGKNLVYSLFVITLLVPSQCKAQPIFSLIIQLNLYDTKTALVLVYIAAGMAMSLFILKNTFMSIPKDFSEAAWMEGSGFLRTFFSINLPMAKSGMATAGILMFLGNWNEYFFAMLLTTSPACRTLPVALASFNETYSYNYTNMFAALTMAILPGILIYAFAQDQVTNSIVASGIKG
ncbi:MAG TPA: carbohydrate ABC transporter permease [Lachnospiraceae bacterium]|nr:carbohydrate ABC transporter permease [Lachnospiraceae bacterium]